MQGYFRAEMKVLGTNVPGKGTTTWTLKNANAQTNGFLLPLTGDREHRTGSPGGRTQVSAVLGGTCDAKAEVSP